MKGAIEVTTRPRVALDDRDDHLRPLFVYTANLGLRVAPADVEVISPTSATHTNRHTLTADAVVVAQTGSYRGDDVIPINTTLECPCARIHGHNWKVKIDVQSEEIDESGIVIDFTELDKHLAEVIGRFDHQLINDIPPFDKINPTAENLVKYIYQELKIKLSQKVSLLKVSIWETDQYMVSYEE